MVANHEKAMKIIRSRAKLKTQTRATIIQTVMKELNVSYHLARYYVVEVYPTTENAVVLSTKRLNAKSEKGVKSGARKVRVVKTGTIQNETVTPSDVPAVGDTVVVTESDVANLGDVLNSSGMVSEPVISVGQENSEGVVGEL